MLNIVLTSIISTKYRFEILKVDITQIIQPEVVQSRGGLGEIVISEASISQIHSCCQAGQNPPEIQTKCNTDRLTFSFISKDTNLSILDRGLCEGVTRPLPGGNLDFSWSVRLLMWWYHLLR